MADHSTGGRQPMRLRCRVEVCPRRPAAAGGSAGRRVHRDVAHGAEVDHEAALAHPVAGEAVPAASHGHLEPLRTTESDGGRYLLRRAALGDDGGPTVDVAVPRRPRDLVALGLPAENDPTELGSKTVNGHLGSPCWSLERMYSSLRRFVASLSHPAPRTSGSGWCGSL